MATSKKQFADGAAVLSKALQELGNMGSKDWKSTMRVAVQVPMQRVKKQAAANLSAISPGKVAQHKTYKGRIVAAGFAARNLVLVVKVNAIQGVAWAMLGVRTEAFYVLSFFELGTSSIPRHPWLTPAMEASKDSTITEVGSAMRKRIDRIAKKRMRESQGVGK